MKPFAAMLLAAVPAMSLLCVAAEPPMDARAAAARVGERVVFEDVVRARSSSSSGKNGIYLSFGAPYPDQVLTVNIPKSLDFWSNDLPVLLNRRVRVEGTVEPSSTGPRITLSEPAQLTVFPIEEAVLTRDDLDGRAARATFTEAVRQVFLRGQIEWLENFARRLREGKLRFRDGTWKLAYFYEAFSVDRDTPQATVDAAFARLEEWSRKYPHSPTPVVAKAEFRAALGWKWRGTDFISKVPKEHLEEFRREIKEAHAILDARPDAASCPHYRAAMQSIAQGESWPKARYVELFNAATAAEPEYHPYYYSAVYYLLPRWHGEPGEWQQFARDQKERLGGAVGAEIYTRIARTMQPLHKNFFEETRLNWEDVAAGFEAMFRRFPGSRYNKNSYALFAFFAGDKQRLRSALAEIGADPDMDVWITLANLRQAQELAAAPESDR